MAPRRRKTHKHLPPGVYYKHGAYYLVKNNKWTRLGKTLSEAMQAWADMHNGIRTTFTMGDLFDRYMTDVIPHKAGKTQKENNRQICNLRVFFGDMEPAEVTPVDIYKYRDIRGKISQTGANRELALLSHVFSYAIEWGAVTANPCKGVRKFSEKRRTRYITDQEFKAVYDMGSALLRSMMEIAYLTGLRRGDITRIKRQDLTEEGLQVHVEKTDRNLLFEWTDELRTAVANAKRIRPTIASMYLYCNRQGKPYTDDGISAMWQRLMNKALEKGAIQERFTFHDIRRKAATDAEQQQGREFARALLGHTTQAMTARYVAGVQRVRPLR